MGKILVDPEKGNPCMPYLNSFYLLTLQILLFFLLLPSASLEQCSAVGLAVWCLNAWERAEGLPQSRDQLKAGNNSLPFSFGRWEKVNGRTSVTKTPSLISCSVIRCFKNPGIHVNLCTLEAFPTHMPALPFLPWSRAVAAWVVLIWFSLCPCVCGTLT